MEMTLFSMINVESPVTVAQDHDESVTELVALDDAKLRQVGGGVCVGLIF